MKTINIRVATEVDYPALADIMYNAIHHGVSDYTPAERQAWLPQKHDGEAWSNRLSKQDVFVAEVSSTLIGFITLSETAYIDMVFIESSYQGKGMFSKLYAHMENIAIARGDVELSVHASMMAQPAFERFGFKVIEEEIIEISGERLKRSYMSKALKT